MNNELDFDVTYDVAVIGGGIAGVAAAIQAARSGMKTVLIEKTVLFGGLATTGLVNVYLPPLRWLQLQLHAQLPCAPALQRPPFARAFFRTSRVRPQACS